MANPPRWVLIVWTATGLCAGWVTGAAGAWAGINAGLLLGGGFAAAVAWGGLYWVAGKSGRVFGALLAAGASAGAAAGLVTAWFAPLLAAWGEVWVGSAMSLRLALAALAGVSLGHAVAARAGDPDLPLPDAVALAETIGWASAGRRSLALLAAVVASGAVRWGLSVGWWPGLVVAGEGRGLAGLLGLAVAPGLLGVGLLLGWERAAALAAGSVGVALVAVPVALAFGPLTAVAPGLRAPGAATGLELHASYGPLVALGALSVAALGTLASVSRGWWHKRERPRVRLTSRTIAAGAAVAFGMAALWRLTWSGTAGRGSLVSSALGPLLGALAAAGAAAALGSPSLAALGLPALAVALPALAFGPETTFAAGALGLTAGLFVADYLQAKRTNLLLDVGFPVYPVKVAACLAGFLGAMLAASTLTTAPVLAGDPGQTGLVSRVALAGASGRLPFNLVLSGGGVGALAWLLARPVWPVAVGCLLPLPAAGTLLLGGLLGLRWRERARLPGAGFMIGDLALQGLAGFLTTWRVLPAEGRWDGLGPVAQDLPGVLRGLGATAALILLACAIAGWTGGFTSRRIPVAVPHAPAGNAGLSG